MKVARKGGIFYAKDIKGNNANAAPRGVWDNHPKVFRLEA